MNWRIMGKIHPKNGVNEVDERIIERKKKKRKKNERYDKWRINKKERKNLIEDEIENKHYMLLINNNSTVKSCVHVLIKEI